MVRDFCCQSSHSKRTLPEPTSVSTQPVWLANRQAAVADLHSKILDTRPLGIQILSTSCSFWKNFAKLYIHTSPPPRRFHAPSWGEILDPPLSRAKIFQHNLFLVKIALMVEIWSNFTTGRKQCRKRDECSLNLPLFRHDLFLVETVQCNPKGGVSFTPEVEFEFRNCVSPEATADYHFRSGWSSFCYCQRWPTSL